jgi:hypothetical protein
MFKTLYKTQFSLNFEQNNLPSARKIHPKNLDYQLMDLHPRIQINKKINFWLQETTYYKTFTQFFFLYL